MAAEISMDVEDFQSLIDSYEDCADAVEALKYEIDKNGVKLKSLDKYKACITKFNLTLSLFASMLEKDVQSMEKIKATFLNMDSEIATKTLGEAISGK